MGKRPDGLLKSRCCKILELSRGSQYYKPKGESQANIDIMEKMDKYSLDHPTSGARTMVSFLATDGIVVNHKRISRLMKVMGLECIYPQKSLSKGGRLAYHFPYLLRHLDITRPNQVWSTDISYIAMLNGFMYLYAIIDVYSRYILDWRLSNDLTASNCTELLDECIARHGAPEILNTDQGCQYTSKEWTEALERYGIRISMDGRGRCKDNIWIERFWRTIKQEYIYLNPTDDVTQMRNGIRDFVEYYNYRRPHQSLGKAVLPYKAYICAA